MKIIYFFKCLTSLLAFFIGLFSEVYAFSSSLVDLKEHDSKRYIVSTEALDVSENKYFNQINQDFDDCINWYSVFFSSGESGQRIVPSIPNGLFILFSKKRRDGCNIDQEFRDRFLSIPILNAVFDTSAVRSFTKLYSKKEMDFELSKIDKAIYLKTLSKLNIFAPNHPEFFSMEDEELSYIHFPQLDIGKTVENESLRGIFELESTNIPIVSLLRISIHNHFKDIWETKMTLTKIEEDASEGNCKYGNFEIVRRLNGSGFHWNLETEIINFEGNSTPIMLDLFSRELFLDIDEISQKNEIRDDGILVPLHPVHIERPSEESDSSLLLSIGRLSNIPIHARYQSACNGCNYKTAILRFPSIIILGRDSESRYCLVSNMKFEVKQSENVRIGGSQREIIINIPVGNSKDIGYVFIITICTIIITTFTTGISIKRY
ncbi:putative signal peptide-containing protein [Cryptosporidium canis]|uniref:Signal peptide-containing protein n=1 Tax=Cryptosporidium canis TaxID=195482 RepID=A0A9D5DJP0_9CRYT|nr:putative signal peptide-containing protein [Cryptosporidium canis]